jgi:hypothetical protein
MISNEAAKYVLHSAAQLHRGVTSLQAKTKSPIISKRNQKHLGALDEKLVVRDSRFAVQKRVLRPWSQQKMEAHFLSF